MYCRWDVSLVVFEHAQNTTREHTIGILTYKVLGVYA